MLYADLKANPTSSGSGRKRGLRAVISLTFYRVCFFLREHAQRPSILPRGTTADQTFTAAGLSLVSSALPGGALDLAREVIHLSGCRVQQQFRLPGRG